MHLFEFMDLEWLPGSLRDTLRDILELGNSWPFRGYYNAVVDEVIQAAAARGSSQIVELGAGTAPITRHLLKREDANHLRFEVCDLNPDKPAFEQLAENSYGRVTPNYNAVDFSEPPAWPADAILVLSATLHHIPSQERAAVLHKLQSRGNLLVVAEPLRKTMLSALYTVLSLFPALLTPVGFIRKPGTWRRILWCWLMPVAPLMFVWDGVVSCLREWGEEDWREYAQSDNMQLDHQGSIKGLFTKILRLEHA